MITVPKIRRGHFPLILLLAVPVILFSILKLWPELDVQAWTISWYTRLIQFYAGSFASLIALIAALFANSTIEKQSSPRTMFVTFAFINIAALLLISSIATPNILIPENNQAFIWSLRFAFPVGAIFFALASVRWNEPWRSRIVNSSHLWWLFGLLALGSYIIIAFAYSEHLVNLSNYASFLPQSLGVIGISLMVFAAWRTWRMPWPEDTQIEERLAWVLMLLVEAQIFQTFGAPGRYSWLLYHPVMLAALLLAVIAILSTFKASADIQVNRYFAALGSIVIGGLSLIIGELGTRFLGGGVNRISVITVVLIQGALSFLVLYVIVIYLNRLITERTVALHREQRLRSELTQLIVHDLKSPLSVITSGINMLNKGNLGALMAPQARLLTNLEQSGQHILYMIDDLLDVERLEAGKLTLKESCVNIVRMLREAVDDLQIVARPHRQTLTLAYPAGIPAIMVDKRLIWRVVNNLISNALKFTPEKGHIEVSVTLLDKYLVVNVADDGPGVPKEDWKRIFEKFAQIQGSERRGAGLGLTFCKMVVEAHGGSLVVSDSHLGGALFQMLLPLPPADETKSAILPNVAEHDWKLETP